MITIKLCVHDLPFSASKLFYLHSGLKDLFSNAYFFFNGLKDSHIGVKVRKLMPDLSSSSVYMANRFLLARE